MDVVTLWYIMAVLFGDSAMNFMKIQHNWPGKLDRRVYCGIESSVEIMVVILLIPTGSAEVCRQFCNRLRNELRNL